MDNYYEEIIDISIKHAGRQLLTDAAAETAVVKDIGFSKEFEKKMMRLINSGIQKKRTLKILKITARVAVILVLFIILSTSVIFSTEALRVKVMNMFLDKGDGQVNVEFFEVDKNNIPVGMMLPDYIPDGYKPKNAYKNGSLFISEYEDASGNVISIHQGYYLTTITIDDDGLGSYSTEILGKVAYVAINKAMNSVYFNSNAYGFSIYGKIDSSELIKIAESILKQDINS